MEKTRFVTFSRTLVLLLGLILTTYGAYSYRAATINSAESIPAGGIDIWAGPATPHQLANVSGTWVTASLVDNSISIEVYFAFPQYQTMHFYAVIPFRALNMTTWVDRNGMYNKGDNSIGEIKSAYHVSANGATIANASFTPSPDIPYFNVTVGLGVKLQLQQLVARVEGATDTVIFTFASPGLMQVGMEPYRIPDTQPVWKNPVLVTVQFPPDAFLSGETFPAPAEYFVASQYRYVSFSVNFYNLDFLNPSSSLVQSISFSFVHPAKEREIQQNLFSGGLLLGLGVPLLVDSLKSFLESSELDKIGKSVKRLIHS